MRKKLLPLLLVLVLAFGGLIASCDKPETKKPYFDKQTVFYLDRSMSTVIGGLDKLCNPGTIKFEADGKAKMNITFTEYAKALMDGMLGARIGDFVHDDTYILNEDKTVITYHPTRDSFEGKDVVMDIERLSDDSMKIVFDIGAVIPDTKLTFYSDESRIPPIEQPEEISYTVSYQVTGDDLEGEIPEGETYGEETEITLAAADFTNGDFVFRGWAANGKIYEHGEKYVYQPGESYTVDSDVEFVAVWDNSCKITFSAGEGGNGADMFMADQTVKSSIVLPANPFLSEDSSKGFAYWLASGSTTKLRPGASYTVRGDVTFTAVWTEMITVSFAAGENGTGNTLTMRTPKDFQIVLPQNSFTYSGENKGFSYWKLSTASTKYFPGAKYTPTADAAFTAIWDVFCSVTFEGDGGTGSEPSQTIVKNTSLTLPENPFTKEGFVFAGWKCGTSSLVKQPGSTYTVTDNLVVKPIWKAVHTVSFDLGAGVTGSIEAVKQGETLKITLPEMTFENGEKVFEGWSDGNKIYKEGAEYTVPTSDVTLHAVWLRYVDVKFQGGDGATGSVDSMTGLETKEIVLPENGYKCAGKIFGGWSDGTMTYKPGDKYVVPETGGDVIFSAVWNEGTPIADHDVIFRASQSGIKVGNDGKADFTLDALMGASELVLRPDLTADFVVKFKPADKDLTKYLPALGLTIELLRALEFEYRNISYTYDKNASSVTLNIGGGKTLKIVLSRTAKNPTAETPVFYDNLNFTFAFKVGEVESLKFSALDGEPKYLESQKVFKGKAGSYSITLTVNPDGTGTLKAFIMSLTFFHIFNGDYSAVIWLGDSGDHIDGTCAVVDGKMQLTVKMLGTSVVLTEE